MRSKILLDRLISFGFIFSASFAMINWVLKRGSQETFLSFYIPLLIFALVIAIAVYSLIKASDFSRRLQVVLLFFVGYLSIWDHTHHNETMGELIIFLSLFVAWKYGFLNRNSGVKVALVSLAAVLIRGAGEVFHGFFVPSRYAATEVVFSFFFFALYFILNNEYQYYQSSRQKMYEIYRKDELFAKLGQYSYGILHETSRLDEVRMLGMKADYSLNRCQYQKAHDYLNQQKAILDVVIKSTSSLHQMTSRRSQSELELLEINQAVWVLHSSMKKLGLFDDLDVSLVLAKDPIHIWCSPKDLYQILEAVVENAVEASRDSLGGNVWIVTERQDGQAVIRINDTGQGFDSEEKDGAVDLGSLHPGTSTKEGHLGWSLYSAKILVEKNWGTVRILSLKGIGTHVTLSFPDAGALSIEDVRIQRPRETEEVF